MSTIEVRDLDGSTAGDWRQFVVRVADYLTSGTDRDEIVLHPAFSPAGLSRPRMRFRTTSQDTIVCATTSLSVAETPWRFDAESRENVVETPVKGAYYVAALAVTELRETWGVLHPSFLVGLDDYRPPRAPDTEIGLAVAHSADSEEALELSVLQCLRQTVGSNVHKSADGNFAVSLGSITAYVYVADPTEVRVHAPIVERISGRTRAAELISDLNRRHPRLKFLLVDDRIHVTASIDASPFIPKHLANAMHRLSEFALRVDDGFAEHFGGIRAADTPHDRSHPVPASEESSEDEVTDLPPQLMTLLELDSVADGTVDVEVVVAVCGGDRSTIVEYEQFCSEQARSWRETSRDAHERGDTDAAAECEAEAMPWDRMVSTLRFALRTVAFYDNA